MNEFKERLKYEPSRPTNMTQAFCLRQKKAVEIKDEQITQTKNGLRRASGICPECGAGVSKILGK
jgi:hypothetical protein